MDYRSIIQFFIPVTFPDLTAAVAVTFAAAAVFSFTASFRGSMGEVSLSRA